MNMSMEVAIHLLDDIIFQMVERAYNNKVIYDIEELCKDNPRKFWNVVKSLGPKSRKQIPLKVYDETNRITCDINTVLGIWKKSFFNLYNCPENDDCFDNGFLENAMYSRLTRENEMLDEGYRVNLELNMDITITEVEKCVRHLKIKKASGFDRIPNEILKNENMLLILFQMANAFFNNCTLPSAWLKALISPIFKGGDKDPLIPLSYRGISLLSCVCKLFTAIVNNRLKNYLEKSEIYSDTQNGFRTGRSCVDHIFTFTSILRNRLEMKKSTFCCFIDMQKAFDFVNRDLLFYCLLNNNVDGKLYNCIKALYSNPMASVKLGNYYTEWFDINSGKEMFCLRLYFVYSLMILLRQYVTWI